MQVAGGDTTFTSRQELIKYTQTINRALTNALPYVTTFSREINGPTWGPTTNIGGAYNYKSNAINAASVNPLIVNIRVPGTAGFPRSSPGSTARPSSGVSLW